MSTGTVNGAAPATSVAVVSKNEREVEFTPLGESAPIRLSINMVRQYLIKHTARGAMPTDADVMQFMMLCKARELNPWVGDAYCVGYDGESGPTFTLITSVQALFKRADGHPEYDGMESGVIVRRDDATYEDRKGDWFAEGEILVGGWAKVYRKDRKLPFEERIRFSTFNKNRSVWKQDPEGMISKCAEAGALRKAFPTQLGGLYLREEFEHRTLEGSATVVSDNAKSMDALTADLQSKRAAAAAITQQAPAEDLAAKAQAETCKREVEQTVAAEETRKPQEASQSQAQAVEAESDVATDFRNQIKACQSEEELKMLTLAIRKSKSLDDDQRRHLMRVVNDRKDALEEAA